MDEEKRGIVDKTLVGNKKDIKAGKSALSAKIRVRTYVKRAGFRHEQFRRDLNNGHLSRSHKQSFDTVEANRLTEWCKSFFIHKKKAEYISQCSQDGKVDSRQYFGDEKYPCFRCDVLKLHC